MGWCFNACGIVFDKRSVVRQTALNVTTKHFVISSSSFFFAAIVSTAFETVMADSPAYSGVAQIFDDRLPKLCHYQQL